MFAKSFQSSRGARVASFAAVAIAVTSLSAWALSAQDKYALQVPSGLALSEFRGYENWQVVAVSQTEDLLKVIVANPTMIEAYRAGIPGNGKVFPEGSAIAKVQWTPKKNTEAPFTVSVPDTLKNVNFMKKDSKRFPKTAGWAYATFNYEPSTDTFTPNGSGTDCGHACHSVVAAKDYMFTAYAKR
jgi:Cytochrome P460